MKTIHSPGIERQASSLSRNKLTWGYKNRDVLCQKCNLLIYHNISSRYFWFDHNCTEVNGVNPDQLTFLLAISTFNPPDELNRTTAPYVLYIPFNWHLIHPLKWLVNILLSNATGLYIYFIINYLYIHSIHISLKHRLFP